MLLLFFLTAQSFAIENESTTQTAISFQKNYENGVYNNFYASTFFKEGFSRNLFSYLTVVLGKRIGNSSYALGWYAQYPRAFDDREIRVYQQYTYRFPLGHGLGTVSAYLDERYFDQSHELGLRTRFRMQWLRPINEHYSVQLGPLIYFALNDVEQKNSVQSGFSQARFIMGLNRNLARGSRVNVNYQLRYLNRAFTDNVIQNHVQFIYSRQL